MMVAWCRDCKQHKPVAEFSRDSKRATNTHYICKVCSAARWAEISEGMAIRRTAQRHNLSVEEVLALQAAGCGVCGRTDVRLDIDHDHACCNAGNTSCGKCVRGALCRPHNMALGHLGDNLDGVLRLVRYLEGD